MFSFFFLIWIFFHEHSRITGLLGKGEGISLTPHYHFHPLHRQLHISRAITAGSSPLRIARVSERKSLTTKLRACFLVCSCGIFFVVQMHQVFSVSIRIQCVSSKCTCWSFGLLSSQSNTKKYVMNKHKN